MDTTTITIPLDADLAQFFNTASREEQQKIQTLLSVWLREMQAGDRETLMSVMDRISDRAQERGLTQEILDELLADDKAA